MGIDFKLAPLPASAKNAGSLTDLTLKASRIIFKLLGGHAGRGDDGPAQVAGDEYHLGEPAHRFAGVL